MNDEKFGTFYSLSFAIILFGSMAWVIFLR